MSHSSNHKFLFPLLGATALFLFAACSGGGEPVAQASTNTQATQPAATPTPEPVVVPDLTTDLGTPLTAEVTPLIARVDAEAVVLQAVSACADGIASEDLAGVVRLFFDSSFDADERAWLVEVTTADFAVTFGRWRLNEGEILRALPDDRTARSIADSELVCAFPTVLLDADPTPPRFVDPADGVVVEEVEDADSVDVIDSPDLASLRVWAGVYSCFQNFPELKNFIARQDVGGVWLVEGRTDLTAYGLWEVSARDGAVTPRDERASQVSASCDTNPVALTEKQATVRVWVATYDCFPAPPPLAGFTAAQESPHRWVVEGRVYSIDPASLLPVGTTLYGLWLVETDNGAITGLDSTARGLRVESCFQPFL